jgi:hypothetical protein
MKKEGCEDGETRGFALRREGVTQLDLKVLLGLAVLDSWRREGKTWSMCGADEEDEERLK